MARNTNEVRRVSDLPEWFDLTKYDVANTLDAAGWYENLSVRGELLNLVGSSTFKKALEEGRRMAQSFKSDLESLRHTPIFGYSEKQRWWSLCRTERIYPNAGVQMMTIADLYWAEKVIDEDKRAYARKIISQTDDSESYYDALLWTEQKKEWKANPLNDAVSHSLIKVNLDLPESELIEQFKVMLKKWKRTERVKTLEFDNWIKFGVLPYLDLKIWERESGKSITNRVMADAIFPDGEGGEEVVRKTTRKHADELLTSNHLKRLAAIAANELAERSND